MSRFWSERQQPLVGKKIHSVSLMCCGKSLSCSLEMPTFSTNCCGIGCCPERKINTCVESAVSTSDNDFLT